MSEHETRNLERAAACGDLDARIAMLLARARSVEPGIVACSNPECKDGKAPLRNGIVAPGRAGPSMHVIGEVDCWDCDGTGRAPWSWPDRWALAAYCGDEAARVLLSGPPSLAQDASFVPQLNFRRRGNCETCGRFQSHGYDCKKIRLDEWLYGLGRWPEALTRAVVAAAEATLPAFRVSTIQWPHELGCECIECSEESLAFTNARLAVEAARAYVECPCEDCFKEWAVAWNRLGDEDCFKEWAVAWNRLGDAKGWIPAPGKNRSLVNVTGLVSECSRISGEDRVLASICAELIPWALEETACSSP